MPGLQLPGLPALRPEFGPALGPGYWPPSGLAGENAQVENALAEAEPAEGALSEGLAVELVAVGHFVEGPEGKAGPLRPVGRH